MFDRRMFLSFIKEAQQNYDITVSLGDEGYEYGSHGVSPITFSSAHPPKKNKTSVADGHPSHNEEIMSILRKRK